MINFILNSGAYSRLFCYQCSEEECYGNLDKLADACDANDESCVESWIPNENNQSKINFLNFSIF